MNYCPICGWKVDQSFQSPCTEPFTHYDPMEGLMIYGPFSSGKQIICHEAGFLHFVINGAEHRLVQLGVTTDENKEEWRFEPFFDTPAQSNDESNEEGMDLPF